MTRRIINCLKQSLKHEAVESLSQLTFRKAPRILSYSVRKASLQGLTETFGPMQPTSRYVGNRRGQELHPNYRDPFLILSFPRNPKSGQDQFFLALGTYDSDVASTSSQSNLNDYCCT